MSTTPPPMASPVLADQLRELADRELGDALAALTARMFADTDATPLVHAINSAAFGPAGATWASDAVAATWAPPIDYLNPLGDTLATPAGGAWTSMQRTLAFNASGPAVETAHAIATTMASPWAGMASGLGNISSWTMQMLGSKRARDRRRAELLRALPIARQPFHVRGMHLIGGRNRRDEIVRQTRIVALLRSRERCRRTRIDPPGRTVSARPQLTRGPDTCRSITHPDHLQD